MALLLNIDTATEIAVVSISEDGKVLDFITNSDQKDHAAFLHPAIKKLLDKTGLSFNKLNAIAVTAGPGSYTGLRVGMATAKGLCYALNIPMITVSTLEVMASSTITELKEKGALYCPLIDARRMEVFTAVYDHLLTEIIKPCSMILEPISFTDLLKTHRVYFFGSGSKKFSEQLDDKNAVFINSKFSPDAMAELANKSYLNKNFADASFAAPVYLKEFYSPAKKA